MTDPVWSWPDDPGPASPQELAEREEHLLDAFLDTRSDLARRLIELEALDAELSRTPLAEPEQVVVAGDWHGDGGAAAEAMQLARRCAGPVHTVVQLGDLGVWPGREGAVYLNAVARAARDLGVDLMFTDGNHDDHAQLLAYPLRPDGLRVVRPRVYHLPRGFRWRWRGLTWAALGGAVSLDKAVRTPYVDWWPEEAITWADAQKAIDGGPVDVLLTHDVPLGVRVPGLMNPRLLDQTQLAASYANQRLLRQVVDELRPARLFHGHMHVRYDQQLILDDGQPVEVTGLADGRDRERSRITVPLSDLRETVAASRAAGAAAAKEQP